jgi:G3E family GTPase
MNPDGHVPLEEAIVFMMSSRLPVTLIGGFLGAGKTSLLHHIISEHQGGYLAVLVENPGALNLDAKAMRGLCGAMRRLQDTVLEIPNAGEEEQLLWMAKALGEISRAGRFERVLVEVAGTTNPARLAEHFLAGGALADHTQLEQIVCAVDALDYLRGAKGPGAAWRGFQDEQIAGGTLVVLNKCDLLDEPQLAACVKELRRAHPRARVAQTAYGEVPLDIWAKVAPAGEIAAALERRAQRPASEFPALSSALYRVHRPFHPGRFWEWFNAEHAGLLRVKGLVWLASRSLLVGGVSRTRWQNSCGAAGIWWAALPREEWPEDEASLRRMQETWREPYGDRRQELVLIGDPVLLTRATRAELDRCLLTDEEFSRPVREWGNFADSFPEWDVEG